MPSATHKKRFSLGVKLAILATIFAVLIPVSASAWWSIFDLGIIGSDDWSATYRTNGMRGPVTNRFSSLANCQAAVNVAKANAAETPPTGVVITDCFNIITDPLTDPAKQRTVGVVKQQIHAENNAMESGRGFLPDALYHFIDKLTLTILFPVLTGLAFLVFKVAGIFLLLMGDIMDWSIRVTIDSQLLGSMQFVNIGWTAVRDFANMFFIFALLYIAIQTILGLGGGGAKRWIAHLIIAAILINFSLFATKVVVDAGNVIAVTIWSKVSTQQDPSTSGATPKFLGGLDLQTIFTDNKDLCFIPGCGGYRWDSMIIIYLGGAIFMFIAGYVLLAGALMMATRTIMLLLLMIFSPFAFMAFGLPKMEQYGHKWLDKLTKQTFVAPFFIFMLYLNAKMVEKFDIFSLSGSKGMDFAGAFVGNGGYQIIFNFIMMIGFLIASLIIANSFAGETGSAARGLAKKASGWAAGGAMWSGGAVLRQTAGRFGQSKVDDEKWQAEQRRLVARGSMKGATFKDKFVARTANLKLATAQKTAKGTYDIRNAPMGGLGVGAALGAGGVSAGAGSKRSYGTTGQALGSLTGAYRGTEKEKELIALDKERYAGDPAAMRASLEMRGVQLDAKRNKELSDQLKREETNKAKIAQVEKELQGIMGGTKKLKDITAKDVAEMNEKIEKMGPEAAKTFTKSFAQALEKIGGKEYTEMGQNFLNLTAVQRNSTGRHVAEINTKLSDGTLTMDNPQYRENFSKNIIRYGNDESARRMVANQARQGNSNFIADVGEELKWAKDSSPEDVREKNIRNAMSFMAPEDIDRMPLPELQEIYPYMNESQLKSMGKKKREALEEMERSKDRVSDADAAQDLANQEEAARKASSERAREAAELKRQSVNRIGNVDAARTAADEEAAQRARAATSAAKEAPFPTIDPKFRPPTT
ncbi:MAG: hypothetical protein Q7S52_03075 [bacterium]|nr:hypothetical protein [bacterium]